MRKILQTLLPFKLVRDGDSGVTAHAGLPLVGELFHQLGLAKLITKWIRVKQRGYEAWQMIEWLVCLCIAGGEHLDDIRILKQDQALCRLMGWEQLACAKSFERFLKLFHREPQPGEEGQSVPTPSLALWGLGEVNRLLVHELILRSGLRCVTLECDATLIESWKKSSQWTYEKHKGYQPALGVVAELGLVVYDEFRNGNVAARTDVKEFVYQCLKAIPQGVKIRCRLDGAYYDHELMSFLRRKKIPFTITARKGQSFLDWVDALPESAWQDLEVTTSQGARKTGRQWAELPWMAAGGSRQEMRDRCYRYLVTRKNQEQWELFKDFEAATRKDRFEVIVTTMDWDGPKLLAWHYEKAGSIEHVHDRIKNDLAGNHMPCQQFGANAAWLRLQVLAHNLLRVLQLQCLPKPLQNVRLKALRFGLFNLAGRVTHHARQILLQLTAPAESFRIYQRARLRIASLAPA